MDGLNYFWEVEVKNGHVTLISEEQDNLADFLHAHTYLGQLKVTLIVIRWAWSNMGVAF